MFRELKQYCSGRGGSRDSWTRPRRRVYMRGAECCAESADPVICHHSAIVEGIWKNVHVSGASVWRGGFLTVARIGPLSNGRGWLEAMRGVMLVMQWP